MNEYVDGTVEIKLLRRPGWRQTRGITRWTCHGWDSCVLSEEMRKELLHKVIAAMGFVFIMCFGSNEMQ